MRNIRKITFLLFIASISFSLQSCIGFVGEKGDGDVVKKELELTDFNAIEAGGAFEIIYEQSDEFKVELITDKNLFEHIETVVTRNTLKLHSKKMLRPTELKFVIQAPDLEKIDFSGASEFNTKAKVELDNLEIESSGAAEIDMNLIVEELIIDVSGAAEIDLEGKAKQFKLDLSGASEIEAYDFIAENVVINSSGASDCEIYAEKSLKVDLSGASKVEYKGNPEQVNSDTSGASSVKKAE